MNAEGAESSTIRTGRLGRRGALKISSGHLSGNRIKITNIMGDYKGRVNTRRRKRRFAKDQRIKALAATKMGATPPAGVAEQIKG